MMGQSSAMSIPPMYLQQYQQHHASQMKSYYQELNKQGKGVGGEEKN